MNIRTLCLFLVKVLVPGTEEEERWWESPAMGSHPEMSVEGTHSTGSAAFSSSML